MKFSPIVLTATLAAMTLPVTHAHAANIDNTGEVMSGISPFGSPHTSTYGQTFTAGADDAAITGFSMFLYGDDLPLTFRGYLATWTGTQAGTLLFTSDDTIISAPGSVQEFAFSTNVAVTAGQQYVAFLSTSDLGGQLATSYTMPLTGNSISGGRFYYSNNALDFSSLFNDQWDGQYSSNDAALKVSFSSLAANAVPEPATWAMMIGGFAMAGGAMRRRKAGATVAYA